jgi:hypothetical protein
MIKADAWPENFPLWNQSIQDKAYDYEERENVISKIRQINSEASTFYNKLRAECEASLEKGGSGHHH